MAGDNTMRAPTAITFHAGQRVVCVDASPNRRCGLKLLARGKIYIIRAIDQKPGWRRQAGASTWTESGSCIPTVMNGR